MRSIEQPAGARRPSRGQVLAEFALVVPLVLLVFVGTFDFARAIYAYNAVSNAAREGTRTAIVNQNQQDIRDRAAAQATALGISTAPAACPPSGSSGICVQFLTSDLSTVCSPADIGCVAQVTVTYTFNPITPVISQLVGNRVITSTSKQPIESTCSGTCPIP